MNDDEPNGEMPDDLERLIAGTFALMTTWYQCPQPAICHKLLENLGFIGQHEAVSDGLKRVCANAAARWAAYLEEVELEIDVDDEDDAVTLSIDPEPGPVTLH